MDNTFGFTNDDSSQSEIIVSGSAHCCGIGHIHFKDHMLIGIPPFRIAFSLPLSKKEAYPNRTQLPSFSFGQRCGCWLISPHSARRSSHPPPEALAYALHPLHLQMYAAQISANSSQQNQGAVFWLRRLTDPTPAADTPAATAVAPEPTKRLAMANAFNGIATAKPPLPRRNHATPVATCASLAAVHHGQLLDSPPLGPCSSIITAAAARYSMVACEWGLGSGRLTERGKSPTGGTCMCFSPCQPTDM
jgi:hypothetical protein